MTDSAPGGSRAPAARPGSIPVRRLLPFLGVVLTLGVLSRYVDLGAGLKAMGAADPGWIALAMVLVVLAPPLVAVKLWLVLKAVDRPHPWRRCATAVMAAVTLNTLLPGRGGDLVRAVFLADARSEIPELAGAVLVERLADVFILGLLALVALPLAGSFLRAGVAGGVCLAALAAFFLLAQGHRLPFKRHLAEAIGRSARRISLRPALLLAVLGSSTLCWLTNAAVFFCCLRAVVPGLPPGPVLASAPLATLAGIVPVSMSGIGTRDAAVLGLLRSYAPADALLGGSFLFTVLSYWFLALVGVLALGRETLRKVRVAVEGGAAGGEPRTIRH